MVNGHLQKVEQHILKYLPAFVSQLLLGVRQPHLVGLLHLFLTFSDRSIGDRFLDGFLEQLLQIRLQVGDEHMKVDDIVASYLQVLQQ